MHRSRSFALAMLLASRFGRSASVDLAVIGFFHFFFLLCQPCERMVANL
jgi:hypothetical protein